MRRRKSHGNVLIWGKRIILFFTSKEGDIYHLESMDVLRSLSEAIEEYIRCSNETSNRISHDQAMIKEILHSSCMVSLLFVSLGVLEYDFLLYRWRGEQKHIF